MGFQAIVLAAGLGTRLWPLTCDRAKPAMPYFGRPVVENMVRHLLANGATRIVVNTHHRPESIRRALASLISEGAPIAFSHETEILGTAGCVAKAVAEGFLDKDEPVFIANAKINTDVDVGSVLHLHRSRGCAVSMVLLPNPSRIPVREVLIDGDRVVGFGEGDVPRGPNPHLFAGLHILEPEVVRTIPVRFCDTVRDIYPPFIERGLVAADVRPNAEWREFSTPERYLALHLDAMERGLGPSVACSRETFVDDSARVVRSILWEGVRVEAGAIVENAILGAKVVIGPGEVVRNEVVVLRSVADRIERGTLWGDRVRMPLGDAQCASNVAALT